MKSKKGFFPRWYYIPMFLFMSLAFIFIVGMYDFTIVEVYEPAHAIINESLSNQVENYTGSVYYSELQANSQQMHNYNIPFNYIYMFIFVFTFVISIAEAMRTPKMEVFELIFGTIGGIIFMIYILQLFILDIVDYFKVQIIDQIFIDLIITYIPFYVTLNENLGFVVLGWSIALIMANWFFGRKEEPTSALSWGGIK